MKPQETAWERMLNKAENERDEARTAIRFLMSQINALAHHAFSDEVDEWLAKNDAMNCGRRALGETSHL